MHGDVLLRVGQSSVHPGDTGAGTLHLQSYSLTLDTGSITAAYVLCLLSVYDMASPYF